MKAVLFWGALLTASSALAGPSCHFKTGNAIVCTEPLNAAAAYDNFGFDVGRTNLSYNREILRQAGCGRAYGENFASARIELVNSGHVSLPTGWVGVSIITVNDKDLWYVASDYIEGECPRSRPVKG